MPRANSFVAALMLASAVFALPAAGQQSDLRSIMGRMDRRQMQIANVGIDIFMDGMWGDKLEQLELRAKS